MSHNNWQHVETLTGQKEKVSSCQFGCYKYQVDWGKFGHQFHVYLWASLALHIGFESNSYGKENYLSLMMEKYAALKSYDLLGKPQVLFPF